MISLRNVSKSFGDQHILEDISFDIKEGEVLSIIGESGSGKSVLMKLVLGLLEPDQGTIEIEGDDVAKFNQDQWNKLLQHFGVVFQGAALFDSLSVLDNVGIRLFEEKKTEKKEIIRRVSEALEMVGLDPTEVLNKFPSELSGGMQKRVGVARAIIHRPRYIFYDEPTTGLDPLNSEKIDQMIASLSDKSNQTAVIITHDMYTVKQLSDRVVMIYDRKIHFMGSPVELFHSDDAVIKAFLQRSRIQA